jgi:hypothetical protein
MVAAPAALVAVMALRCGFSVDVVKKAAGIPTRPRASGSSSMALTRSSSRRWR